MSTLALIGLCSGCFIIGAGVGVLALLSELEKVGSNPLPSTNKPPAPPSPPLARSQRWL